MVEALLSLSARRGGVVEAGQRLKVLIGEAQYGTLDPLEVPGRMLLVGEYARLSQAILALSGLDGDPEEHRGGHHHPPAIFGVVQRLRRLAVGLHPAGGLADPLPPL